LGYRISIATGTYDSDDFEELLFRQTDLLVVTPEKLDLLLRAQPEFLENVRLFVLDEAHIVHDSQRGIKFELLLTRLKRKLHHAHFIVLSAVVLQEILEDFATWFNASSDDDILTSSWRPSIQRYAKLEWRRQTGVIRYAPDNEIQQLQEFVPGVIRQRKSEYTNPKTGRINRRRFPDKSNKAQVAAELAYKFAKLGPVLNLLHSDEFCPIRGESFSGTFRTIVPDGFGNPSLLSGNLKCSVRFLSERMARSGLTFIMVGVRDRCSLRKSA